MLGDIERRAEAIAGERADVSARLNRIADALHGIGEAQQGYVAPGQPDAAWLEAASTLFRHYYDEMSAVGVLLRSPQAAGAVEGLAAASDALIAADTRARENLRVGQEALAAAVIYGDARDALDAMLATVRQLQEGEQGLQRADAAAHAGERARIAAAVVALWALGVGLLAFVVPASTPGAATAESSPAAVEPGRAEAAASKPGIDLPAAADLCVSLSRVSSTAALPALLARAGEILDAPGIILWLGAGDELFPVTAHGYRPAVMARLGSIPRRAQNAPAAAWRDGRLTVVPAEAGAPGAVVAPLFGPDACVGVLSVEIKDGREADPAVQSVASMIAAQLATAVSAWPVASQGPDAARRLRSAGA
jgi:hypothetical protein